ncbi:hypothetical protein MMG00_00815 [Ignatzschineria rhizosphaerae]|uniref:Lipoprotein n=1 Tax=Ignatzschineria rhizosphaerae TaxID=2923279 RepID=A0ABY3X0L2_9GAMM|nr:hypothetical protein [Ignatzschineria rhizosphaerae]UNM96444.1 hypothetical protein MMG00_00815 [Ignatzschineria rhizosphaerae]
MKLITTLLFSVLALTACAKLHPLEEQPKFNLPQVVKPEDMIIEAPKETEVVATEDQEEILPIDEEAPLIEESTTNVDQEVDEES